MTTPMPIVVSMRRRVAGDGQQGERGEHGEHDPHERAPVEPDAHRCAGQFLGVEAECRRVVVLHVAMMAPPPRIHGDGRVPGLP